AAVDVGDDHAATLVGHGGIQVIALPADGAEAHDQGRGVGGSGAGRPVAAAAPGLAELAVGIGLFGVVRPTVQDIGALAAKVRLTAMLVVLIGESPSLVGREVLPAGGEKIGALDNPAGGQVAIADQHAYAIPARLPEDRIGPHVIRP